MELLVIDTGNGNTLNKIEGYFSITLKKSGRKPFTAAGQVVSMILTGPGLHICLFALSSLKFGFHNTTPRCWWSASHTTWKLEEKLGHGFFS